MNTTKQAKKNRKTSKVKKAQLQRTAAVAYLKGIDEVKYIVVQWLERSLVDGGNISDLCECLKMEQEEDGSYSTIEMSGYQQDHKLAPKK